MPATPTDLKIHLKHPQDYENKRLIYSTIGLKMYTSCVKNKEPDLMFQWVVKNRLARGRRPGIDMKRGGRVPRSVVDAWIRKAKAQGIRSIICLLSQRQLKLYENVPGGLVSYVRSKGLEIVHVNAPKKQSPPMSDEHLIEAVCAYQSLRKPVLVHCSAGNGRTGMAVRYMKRLFPVER